MPKIRSNRGRLAAIATAALMVSGLGIAGATEASATGCRVDGVVCGAVKNRTTRTMSYTTVLHPTVQSGDDACDLWNWNGGTGSSSKHAGCKQHTMGQTTVGGNFTGVDVDAFTYAGYGYHERFYRTGTWNWRKKGVWTKISTGQIADCGIGDGNEIWCTVLWQ